MQDSLKPMLSVRDLVKLDNLTNKKMFDDNTLNESCEKYF